VRLFGRSKPLHQQLADEAGLSLSLDAAVPAGLPAEPPGWDGEQRGEPGIHGVPRARRWDVVTVANAPALRGDAVHFVALSDGTLVVDEDEPDDALSPLADALEAKLPPPYRAEAIRRGKTSWAVAGRRIAIVEDSSIDGDEAELVVTAQNRSLTVDGQQRIARAPGLQAAGEQQGAEYVVRASRVDGELWEVEATAL
jgi:hypothetical protein